MPVTAPNAAPYAPGSTLFEVVARHRDRGLPSPINAEVLGRAGISESLIPRTLQALQLLDLTDKEGRPTETFEGIRRAPEAEYRERLQDWIKGAYAEVFQFVDPAKDDATRIRDAFRDYTPHGQQDRMVSLFLALCTAAGLTPKPAEGVRPARPQLFKRAPSPLRPVKPFQKPSSFLASARAAAAAAASAANNPPPSTLPPALAGLLASLPANNSGWTKETRDKFLTTFAAVLDFCVPVVKAAPARTESGGHDE